jgi:hypothetical protein
MATAAAATSAAAQQIGGGKNHLAVLEINVAGPKFRPGDPTLLGTMKGHDAGAAQAGLAAEFRGNLRQQFIGN